MPRMIVDPEAYFASLTQEDPEHEDFAERLHVRATQQGVPVVGPVMGRLLEMLCMLSGALHVLELGTAIGYSTLFLARAMRRSGGCVASVDMNPQHCAVARETLAHAGLSPWGSVVCADARCLPLDDGGFDFLFLDVDQRYYAELEPVCHAQLRPGGLLVADNTAFRDSVEFNAMLLEPSRWLSVNLLAFLPQHAPELDGFCLAIKI